MLGSQNGVLSGTDKHNVALLGLSDGNIALFYLETNDQHKNAMYMKIIDGKSLTVIKTTLLENSDVNHYDVARLGKQGVVVTYEKQESNQGHVYVDVLNNDTSMLKKADVAGAASNPHIAAFPDGQSFAVTYEKSGVKDTPFNLGVYSRVGVYTNNQLSFVNEQYLTYVGASSDVKDPANSSGLLSLY